MFIPLADINRRSTTPWFNYLFIAANIIVHYTIFETGRTAAQIEQVFATYALIPSQFQIQDMFTSMFMHVNWFHLLGNMLFLWIFGDNIEDRFGHLVYVAFYLAAGVVAAAVHVITVPAAAMHIPTLGASGAVSGVLGAYLILFPRVRVLVYVGFVFFTRLPSWFAIGLWFVLQLIPVFLLDLKDASDIAYWAHIGGFVFGFIVTLLLRALGLVTPGPFAARTLEDP